MVSVEKMVGKTKPMSVHMDGPQKNDIVEWGGKTWNQGIEDSVDNTNCQKDDVVDESLYKDSNDDVMNDHTL